MLPVVCRRASWFLAAAAGLGRGAALKPCLNIDQGPWGATASVLSSSAGIMLAQPAFGVVVEGDPCIKLAPGVTDNVNEPAFLLRGRVTVPHRASVSGLLPGVNPVGVIGEIGAVFVVVDVKGFKFVR